MVNHIMRRRQREKRLQEKESTATVPVMNLSGRTQAHGLSTIPADGHWHDVPESLAQRLVGDPQYRVAGAEGQRRPHDVPHPKERTSWPSVGIIVPVYDAPDLLDQCLTSLTQTAYAGRLDYVLVDNASANDKTARILQSRDFASVRFDSPVGFAAAVNAGIGAIPGLAYYVLFNQDCRVVDESWLQHLINWMEYRSDCAVCGPKLLYPGGTTIQQAGIEIPAGTIGRHRFAGQSSNLPIANCYERVQAITGAVFCIRAKAIQDIGVFDEGYLFGCEDVDFCLRASQRGWAVWYIPDSEVIHEECGVRKLHPNGRTLQQWVDQSSQRFRRQWGAYVDKVKQPEPSPGMTAWDREDWLKRMGWRISKGDVNLPNPKAWPSVGVVIPVYNAPELLERCITSLRQTAYTGRLHIQFVDNASTNRKTLSSLGKERNVTRFDRPVGFSEAINAGIRALPPCDYHILMNQDIAVIDSEWLNHLVRWMEARPECAACGPKLLYDDGRIEAAGIDMLVDNNCAERGRGCDADDPRYNEYRKVPTVGGSAFCLRASVEDEMGLFDERYLFGCEDLEYGMRLSAKMGLEVWYVPHAVLNHSCHAVRKANPQDRARIDSMHRLSAMIYREEWGSYCDHLAKTRIAFILPHFNSVAGGARVVAALARQLSICGVRAEVFVREFLDDPDNDFPRFPVRSLKDLTEADIVVATRFDTLADARRVKAEKRYYLVQQIEDVMAKNCGGTSEDVFASYRDTDFEIITISEYLARRLKEMGRQSHILDVGFYRSLYPYAVRRPQRTPPRVLMYGSSDYHKGPDQAGIAQAIRKAAPNVIINAVHRQSARARWADLHLRPKTTAEMASVYADHDVYVYASLSDGFAMTPVEAMACGTPVVLTDFPGKDQYARHEENCLIAGFRDADSVARAVERMLSDEKLRKQVIAHGLETADHYDWNKVGPQYARLLLGAPV